MGERSAIEWTDATWNPWHGCTKVSPGCKHCYMYREKKQYGQDPTKVVRSKTTFGAPLRWKEPRRIFTCSWSDFFHEAADPWRDEAWEVIRQTPQHTYLILTKRPELAYSRLAWSSWRDYPENVWIGTSVETQEYAWRIERLLKLPAARYFLSAEPLLGPLTIENVWIGENAKLDWVIVGGESGPKARPMDLAWARVLRNECNNFGIPFFLKQLGGVSDKRGHEAAVLDGRRWTEVPA